MAYVYISDLKGIDVAAARREGFAVAPAADAGMSTAAKVGIGAVLVAAAGGVYMYFCPKAKRN